MFKIIIILVFILAAIPMSYAKHFIQGEIQAVELAVADETGNKSLCITYLYSERYQKTYGIVEDIYDCFYARKFINSIGLNERIPSSYLFKTYPKLKNHLLQRKDRVHYIYSDYE